MAFSQRVPGSDLSGLVSPSVTAITLDSNGNYSSGGIPFGTCVKVDTTDTTNAVVPCSAAGDKVDGIAITDPAAGPGASVLLQTMGVAKCLAGGAINYGDLVYCGDASGRVTTAPAPGVSQKYIVGKALEPATAAGDLISVQLGIFGATNVNA